MLASSQTLTRFNAYLDEVDLCECLVVTRLLNVEDRNDVLVIEVPQQLHLSQRSQTEHRVVERRDLLDGHLLARRLVQRRAVKQSAVALPAQWQCTYQTTPYAPSPTTSWISYCSETLKEIFLELPPAGGMLAAVVDCRLGYRRSLVGRSAGAAAQCLRAVGGMESSMEVDSMCDGEEVEHDLRRLFVSARTGKVELWPLSERRRLCLGSYPPGPEHLMVKRCSVMTVSSAPRAPLRRGTKRGSRVDNGSLAGQRTPTSRRTATM